MKAPAYRGTAESSANPVKVSVVSRVGRVPRLFYIHCSAPSRFIGHRVELENLIDNRVVEDIERRHAIADPASAREDGNRILKRYTPTDRYARRNNDNFVDALDHASAKISDVVHVLKPTR